MTEKPPEWITFDAGALIACERNDRQMSAILTRINTLGTQIAVPAGALGQVWRNNPKQALLARLIKSARVNVVALDEDAAKEAGVLCGQSGTHDLIDASVVICARAKDRCPIVTSDPDDMKMLDPTLLITKI